MGTIDYTKALFRIHDIVYIPTSDEIKVGDLVIDKRDMTYGYCEFDENGRIAVRDGIAIEFMIPKARCLKLIPHISTNSLN